MENNELKKYYDQKDLWENPITDDQYVITSTILKMLPTDVKSILDVGCGRGTVTNYLPKDISITGIDISEEALKYVEANKVVGDIRELPFDSKSYDLVLCSDTLEHFEDSDLDKVVKEIKRVSAEYILIAVPHKEYLDYSYAKCNACQHIYHINWHHQSFDIDRLKSLFEDQSYALQYYTYVGSNWPYFEHQVCQSKHSLDEGWVRWGNAVCPNCKTPQKDAGTLNDSYNELFQDITNWSYKNSAIGENAKNIPREIILLFSRNSKKDKASDISLISEDEQIEISGSIYLNLETNENKSIDLEFYDISSISPNNPLCLSREIHYYGDNSYIVANDYMDWTGIESIDGNNTFVYYNNKGDFCHAPFILITKCEEFYFQIEYKDTSTEVVFIEVYDNLTKSYIRLGELESANDNNWKSTMYKINRNIEPSASGYLLRFLTVEQHPTTKHFIKAIEVISNSKQSIFKNINYDSVGKKHNFNVLIAKEDINNINIIIKSNDSSKIEKAVINRLGKLILYPDLRNFIQIPRFILTDTSFTSEEKELIYMFAEYCNELIIKNNRLNEYYKKSLIQREQDAYIQTNNIKGFYEQQMSQIVQDRLELHQKIDQITQDKLELHQKINQTMQEKLELQSQINKMFQKELNYQHCIKEKEKNEKALIMKIKDIIKLQENDSMLSDEEVNNLNSELFPQCLEKIKVGFNEMIANKDLKINSLRETIDSDSMWIKEIKEVNLRVLDLLCNISKNIFVSKDIKHSISEINQSIAQLINKGARN